MRRLTVLIALLLAFSAAAETTHAHEDACDAPCPAACLGAPCGVYCDIAASRLSAPDTPEKQVFADRAGDPVARAFEDEIFHPPAL